MPLEHRLIMLLLRIECLAGAAKTAIEKGDSITAARMTAELLAVADEARKLEEQARAI